jgi:rhamnose utilization protein RhaD (predicted bifunctional aldolase and dehydrogenase)
MDGEKTNGAAQEAKAQNVARMTLTFDRVTSSLSINGDTICWDEAIDMLARAMRSFEDKRKLEVLAQMQRQQADAALTAQVRAGLKH